jgi:predicted dehydrogenase
MKYGNDLCVNLVATRAIGPEAVSEEFCCFGREDVLMLGREKMRIQTRAGEKLKQKRLKYDADAAMKKTLEDFALSIIEPEENPLRCVGREQLQNMAVIEAAYLSSRTSMPEQPRRILALEDTGPTLFKTIG